MTLNLPSLLSSLSSKGAAASGDATGNEKHGSAALEHRSGVDFAEQLQAISPPALDQEISISGAFVAGVGGAQSGDAKSITTSEVIKPSQADRGHDCDYVPSEKALAKDSVDGKTMPVLPVLRLDNAAGSFSSLVATAPLSTSSRPANPDLRAPVVASISEPVSRLAQASKAPPVPKEVQPTMHPVMKPAMQPVMRPLDGTGKGASAESPDLFPTGIDFAKAAPADLTTAPAQALVINAARIAPSAPREPRAAMLSQQSKPTPASAPSRGVSLTSSTHSAPSKAPLSLDPAIFGFQDTLASTQLDADLSVRAKPDVIPSSASSSSPSLAMPSALLAPALANPAQTVSAPSQPLSVALSSPSEPLASAFDRIVGQLDQALDTARSNRPELTMRTQDFGSVAIRLDASASDWRAVLSARDPALVPAVQAALAERTVLASGEAGFNLQTSSQRSGGEPQSQSSAQSGGGHGSAGFGGSESRHDRHYGSPTGGLQSSAKPYLGEDSASGRGAMETDRIHNSARPAQLAAGGALFA